MATLTDDLASQLQGAPVQQVAQKRWSAPTGSPQPGQRGGSSRAMIVRTTPAIGRSGMARLSRRARRGTSADPAARRESAPPRWAV